MRLRVQTLKQDTIKTSITAFVSQRMRIEKQAVIREHISVLFIAAWLNARVSLTFVNAIKVLGKRAWPIETAVKSYNAPRQSDAINIPGEVK